MTISPHQLTASGQPVDVRGGDPRDAIDGVVPVLVVEPQTPAAVAASLAWASANRLAVLIQGAGTKRAWGRRPDRLDVIISMRTLDRVLNHRPGDLTVSVQAGASLRDLNEALGAHGQSLPLDPPSGSGATIGGLLATNESGPARHRFGTPRDLVIGVQLATVDGRLANAGGQVVKNVAGYDLSKLVCGSFGALAAIVSATFKLAPVPAASRTLVIDTSGPELLTRAAGAIAASQLEPLAFECRARRTPSGRDNLLQCLVRFASVAAAVDAQAAEAMRLLAAAGATGGMLTGDQEAALWRAHTGMAGDDPAAAVVRLSWLPADLGRVVSLVEELGTALDVDLRGRAAVGAGLMRLAGDRRQQVRAIERLRASNAVGNVVVASASTELKAQIDVWGPGATSKVLDALKSAVDPTATLVSR